jgi:hypothetical protein
VVEQRLVGITRDDAYWRTHLPIVHISVFEGN